MPTRARSARSTPNPSRRTASTARTALRMRRSRSTSSSSPKRLSAALAARDYGTAAGALSAAQAAVHSEDGRYYLTNLQFQYARETNNLPLQTSTIDALIANGRTSPTELGQLYALRGTLAVYAGER